jgi:phosphoadenosine phosphosulfate reductase
MPVDDAEILELSQRAESLPADQILKLAFQRFHPRIAVATAFGAEGMVVLDLLSRIEPRAKVFYIDTQFFFPETYRLIEQVQKRYRFEWVRILPELSPEEQSREIGPELYRSDPDRCCQIRKVLPLKKFFERAGLDGWVASLRREQSESRAGTGVVERDVRFGLVKFNPLARWTWSDVWLHIRVNEVPYNPLHDRAYPSVGCWPCTRAVAPGESFRAGRWAGTLKTECGLHPAKGERR